MRRKNRIAALAAALVCLAGCASPKNAAYVAADGVDIDLTRLSGQMVYAEVFNMRYEPEDYYGKVIRVSGLFSAYQNPDTGEYYYNCIVPDATACCSQGIQFLPRDALAYPDDFPENGADIVITGTYSLVDENAYMGCLADADMEPAAP